MAQIACKYHPDRPARWVCKHCRINFCYYCGRDEAKAESPGCPVCGRTLLSLGAANVITPFWRRIGRFYLYPLNLHPLVLMLALSVPALAIEHTPLGFVAALIGVILFMRYGYAVLEHTAQGHLEPPQVTRETVFEELEQPFKQLLLVFAMVAFNLTVLDLFGNGPFYLTTGLTVLAAPASVMVLVSERSFFRAINPLAIVSLIRSIGSAYLLLCALLLMLVVASRAVFQYLPAVPPEMSWLIIFVVNMYFALIMFHITGYVIYQYHDMIGYEAGVVIEEHGRHERHAPHDSREMGLNQVKVLLKEGHGGEALERLRQRIEEVPGDLEARQLYHRLLRAGGQDEACVQHGEQYLTRLMAAKQSAQAFDLFLELHAIDPDWRPRSPGLRLDMAVLLESRGKPDVALAVLNDFHRAHPDFEGIPRAYLIAARLLCERFGQDDKAYRILQFVTEKYPHDASIAEVREYLQMLEALHTRQA